MEFQQELLSELTQLSKICKTYEELSDAAVKSLPKKVPTV